MHTQNPAQSLEPWLRIAIVVTAIIDLVIGLLFLFGPELNFTLWPTAVPRELMRFIGAIVFGNGVGAALIVQHGTWEGARVLFTVALVYGLAIMVFLLYDLAIGKAVPVFWIYVSVDAVFLIPILYIYFTHEQAYRRTRSR